MTAVKDHLHVWLKTGAGHFRCMVSGCEERRAGHPGRAWSA